MSLDVTLCMLAGGRSSRMGWPKSELRIDGVPIAAFILERLKWQGPTLLITAPGRERPAGCEAFDREVVDPTSDEGPLRGVHTALSHVDTSLAVIVTIDMPLVQAEQIERLVDSVGPLGAMSSTLRHPEWYSAKDQASTWEQDPSRSTAQDDRLRLGAMSRRIVQPFPCVLRRESLELVKAKLRSGRRSVGNLLVDARISRIDAPGAASDDVWLNLNTPTDVDELARRVAPLHAVVPPPPA